MTSVEIRFRYQGKVPPETWLRTQESHHRYGIRRLHLDEENHLIRVEYDATRLDERNVAAVLRGVGVPVVEQVTD